MKIKAILIIIALIVILSILVYFIRNALTGSVVSQISTNTKAICNESNFCQDYIITCENKTVLKTTPITGAVTQKSEDWEDPRQNKELCP